MARSIGGALAGLVAWFVVATLGNFALRAALPGYTAVEATMEFSDTMLWARLLLGAVSSLTAGVVAGRVASRDRRGVLVLAVLLLALFVPVHYSLWARFPAWYHVVFLLSLALVPFAGATIAARRFGAPAGMDTLPP